MLVTPSAAPVSEPARLTPEASNTSASDVSIPELDGLRGIACLTVVLGHFDAVTSRVSFFPAWQAVVTTLNASMGVICFFTLSGFLLTYLAAIEFRRTGRFDVRAFYVRRAFRIWPLHFTVLATVMLLVAPFGPLAIESRAYQWCLEHLWMYVLFLNNWSLAFYGVGGHVDLSPPMLNISWSIAIEEQIYLVFPLVMLGILGAARRRQVTVIALVIGVALAYRLIALLWWGPLQPGRAGTIYLGTLTYLDVVLAGGLAGWLCATRRLGGLASQTEQRRPLPIWVGVVILVGLIAVSLAWRYIERYGSTPLDVVVYPLMGAVFGGGMLWIADRPGSWVARALRWPPLRVLGTLSFGIYLWHFTARTITYQTFEWLRFRPRGQEQIDLLAACTFLTYLALSVLLATLSYTLVERRFLALRVRLSQRRASRQGGRPRPEPTPHRRAAPAPRFVPVTAACLAVATLGLGLAHLLVRR